MSKMSRKYQEQLDYMSYQELCNERYKDSWIQYTEWKLLHLKGFVITFLDTDENHRKSENTDELHEE